MPTLRLQSDSDTINLNEVETDDLGLQVTAGATGLGLPPVQPEYIEGAGDGATYGGGRVLSRDMDFNVYVRGADHAEIKRHFSRLALMLANGCTLFFAEDEGAEWFTPVHLVGGGDYVYGGSEADTTGGQEVRTSITLRAGDPFFSSSQVSVVTIAPGITTGLLTGSLATFTLASSQAIGVVEFSNPGTAPAYPVWTVKGPGDNFKAIAPNGDMLWWTGSLATGEWLVIDTLAGTVIDGNGTNRYDKLADMPRMWSIQPGTSNANVSLSGATPNVSKITCQWRPRTRFVL